MVFNVKSLSCPNCDEFLSNLDLKICPHCGIELLIQREKFIFFPEEDISKKGEFDPYNIWLLADPIAIANFILEGKLVELEQDIRYNVMRGEPWQEVDLEYLYEIKRLLELGVIKKTTSYWFCSPFPTIYKALKKGSLRIFRKKYIFKKGEEIVWRCQMDRELRNLDGPVLIGKFTYKKMTMYCKEMENTMKGKRILIKR